MRRILNKYRDLSRQESFYWDVFSGFVLLFAGLFVTYYSNSYTVSHASNSVTDIILDSLPTINVDFIYSGGAWFFTLLLIAICFYEPRRIPFMLKVSGFFFFIRAIFMVLTHLAPPLHASYVDGGDLLHQLSSGDDLFFSAHTGFPFLMALIFWRDKWLKPLFLACTLVGGGAVLLGHLHYSIDVFSAFFISFGVLEMAKRLFRKDYARLAETYAT